MVRMDTFSDVLGNETIASRAISILFKRQMKLLNLRRSPLMMRDTIAALAALLVPIHVRIVACHHRLIRVSDHRIVAFACLLIQAVQLQQTAGQPHQLIDLSVARDLPKAHLLDGQRDQEVLHSVLIDASAHLIRHLIQKLVGQSGQLFHQAGGPGSARRRQPSQTLATKRQSLGVLTAHRGHVAAHTLLLLCSRRGERHR
mmetsp:Transcript_12316/g.31251  ORF Transcript_12316/g.31251 Transcript_12316/m.31251 type:complete len:201 (-) Transcript_12316:545-1147(-)